MHRENALMRHGDLNIFGILRFAPIILAKQTPSKREAQDDKLTEL